MRPFTMTTYTLEYLFRSSNTNFKMPLVPTVEIPEGVPKFRIEDYTFVKEIGRKAIGSVSKVVNKLTGEFYAIKNLNTISDEINCKRNQRNIQHDMILATSVNHPNVMRCLGVCRNESGIYFLYDLMSTTFSSVHIKNEQKLAKMAYQALLGLDYLRKEKNIVFKHLTPGNMLLDSSEGVLKIGDVGIVKDKCITVCCVPIDIHCMRYIAPENFNMDNQIDLQSEQYRKSDVWSLGLCLLEFYVGGYPFEGYDDYEYEKFTDCLLSGFDHPSGWVGVGCDVWPPKAPSQASPMFADFISSCLKLDVSERADIDFLLAHDFISSNCFPNADLHSSGHIKNMDAPSLK